MLDVSALYSYNSALTFSYAATNVALSAAQLAAGEGYEGIAPGARQTLFFGDRGAGNFNPWQTVDLGLNYSVPVLKQLRPYVKLDVLNVFNDDSLRGFNTAVTPDAAGPRDELGLPLNYVTGPRFGQARAADRPPARPGVPRAARVQVLEDQQATGIGLRATLPRQPSSLGGL